MPQFAIRVKFGEVTVEGAGVADTVHDLPGAVGRALDTALAPLVVSPPAPELPLPQPPKPVEVPAESGRETAPDDKPKKRGPGRPRKSTKVK